MLIVSLLLAPSIAYAGLADSYVSLLSLIHGLLSGICLFAGAVLTASSVVQFKLHRDNPTEVKLKVPVILLVLGAILLMLSYMPTPV